jgi:hypothetical protein
MNMTPEKWNEYTKFCFIRHPYTRALSGWKHYDIVFNKKSLFSNYIHLESEYVSDIEYGHIFMNQSTQIKNEDGSCGVNIIGKFENLEEDFRIILNQIGFKNIIHVPKKENVSNKSGSENTALEISTIKKLNELFSNDFELFHYIKIPV